MLNRDLLALVRMAPLGAVRTALCGVLITAAYVVQGLLIAWILAALFRGDGIAATMPAAGGVLAVVLLRAGLLLWRQHLQHDAAQQMKLRLRARLYAHLRSVGPGYLPRNRTGDLQAMMVDGVEGMDAYTAKYLPQLIVCLCGPIPLVIWIATVSPYAALAITLFILAVPLLPRIWSKLLAKRGAGHWSSYADVTAEYVDAMQGLPTLKALAAEDQMRQRLQAHTDRLYRDTMSQLKVSLVDPGLVAFATITGACAGTLIAAVQVIDGSLAVFEMFAILLLARECFRPFAELSGYWHAGYLGISAAGGIIDFLKETPRRGVSATPAAAVTSYDAVPVRFDGVTYRYPDSTSRAVDQVSFEIPRGATLAVVGASGAGKSTLVSLITGILKPDEGSVSLLGNRLDELSAEQAAAMVSVVWQQTYLFHGSIADNLRVARPDATGEELHAALDAAGLAELVERLPDGIDAPVGEHGTQLSGGERQRVAIARALLADTPVVVLDEATSSLDAQRESQVSDALRRLAHGRTTIVIAHRLSTVRDADEIVVLDRGRVVERGTHDELAGRDGQYAELLANARVEA